MSREGALARRYARALHEVASAQAGAAVTLRDELTTLVRLVAGHPELRARLARPGRGAETAGRLLGTVARQAGGSPLLLRLIELLAGHDRLALLPAVAEAYATELNAAQGIVKATAVSAAPLDEPQRKALAGALCEAIGKRVELETEVDPALIGGLLVRVAGRTYDGSVRARLTALGRRLRAES